LPTIATLTSPEISVLTTGLADGGRVLGGDSEARHRDAGAERAGAGHELSTVELLCGLRHGILSFTCIEERDSRDREPITTVRQLGRSHWAA
jgi:hypothetical protein